MGPRERKTGLLLTEATLNRQKGLCEDYRIVSINMEATFRANKI